MINCVECGTDVKHEKNNRVATAESHQAGSRAIIGSSEQGKMAATLCFCSLLVFLICWASYAPQSFADLVVIKTPTLLRITTIFIPVRNSTRNISTKRCITDPLRLQQVSWSKHGYTCRSPPALHRDIDITIYMDISLNPGPERCQNDGLRALYLNATSLKAYVASDDSRTRNICKITILQELVYSGDFDAVGICETWLNESVIDSEIIPGYSIFRRDREDLGGGAIVAVKGNIQASRRLDLEGYRSSRRQGVSPPTNSPPRFLLSILTLKLIISERH